MMETLEKNYCLILAGGIGRRLWPASTKQLPKQFIDFFGSGRTLLQQTFDRFARFIPREHIFISTFEDYVPLVREQLPEVPEQNILPEPVQLNTAQAAVWGTWHVALKDAEARVVVSPADQLVQHADRFEEQIGRGLAYVAAHDEFLALGVRPTMPNTAYGYIQMGEETGEGLYKVQSFSEKPALDYARMFMDSGEFLWNTGIFLWRAQVLGDTMARLAGRPSENVETLARQMVTIAEEMAYVRSSFSSEMPRSIDLFVLEKCPNVAVQECTFGWADVGCWTGLRECGRQDADGNMLSGDARVMFSGTQRCMVRLPKEKRAVIAGLDNYLVAEQGDVLLICPNDDPDLVRRLINEAQVEL